LHHLRERTIRIKASACQGKTGGASPGRGSFLGASGVAACSRARVHRFLRGAGRMRAPSVKSGPDAPAPRHQQTHNRRACLRRQGAPLVPTWPAGPPFGRHPATPDEPLSIVSNTMAVFLLEAQFAPKKNSLLSPKMGQPLCLFLSISNSYRGPPPPFGAGPRE